MDNRGKFTKGTVFIGNVNKVKMEIVEIQKETAVIKDVTTGKVFTYGLRALERCNVAILGGQHHEMP